LIETVTTLVADRLGLPPDGGAAPAPVASPAPAASPAPSSSSSAACPARIASGGADRMSVPSGARPEECKAVARMIDHTLLKPNAREEDVLKLCEEARQYGFASVCVNGSYVELAASALRGSGVMTCMVVGFPLGAMTPEAKAFEAAD